MVAHERVKGMYSWVDVAGRTEIVYERAMATPHTAIQASVSPGELSCWSQDGQADHH